MNISMNIISIILLLFLFLNIIHIILIKIKLKKKCKNSTLFWSGHPEPISWRYKLPWWFKLSSFFGLPTFLSIMINPNLCAKYCPIFPWRFIGLIIFTSSITSYMGDVYTWGYNSIWKKIDIVVAITAFLFNIILILLHYFGMSKWPDGVIPFYTKTILIAFCCKIISAHYVTCNKSIKLYLIWHTLWHIFIFFPSFFCIIYFWKLEKI